jgi:hypothetical protein
MGIGCWSEVLKAEKEAARKTLGKRLICNRVQAGLGSGPKDEAFQAGNKAGQGMWQCGSLESHRQIIIVEGE